jgi:N-acetylneuraminate synthase
MDSSNTVSIGPYTLGVGYPPLIVAELSGNHNGSLDRALEIVRAAKAAGADAIKLQTYTPDTITLNVDRPEFYIQSAESLWYRSHLYNLYAQAYTPAEWHLPIVELCKTLNLLCFSTPFDETAVDFLETLDLPCYKISSPEIVDLPLIRKAAATGKPLIISTGAATLSEVDAAVTAARHAGCRELILLKCTAAYPATAEDFNLRTLPHLSATFKCPVGLSDHSLCNSIAIASVALGACYIEKHFTLNRADGGVDHAFSIEPGEIALLSQETKRAWAALGDIFYGPLPSEATTHSHRPSLYIVADLPSGTALEPHHVRSVRPGLGLPPSEIDNVLGLELYTAVTAGTPVQYALFKKPAAQ